jgi:hypothetical protein
VNLRNTNTDNLKLWFEDSLGWGRGTHSRISFAFYNKVAEFTGGSYSTLVLAAELTNPSSLIRYTSLSSIKMLDFLQNKLQILTSSSRRMLFLFVPTA